MKKCLSFAYLSLIVALGPAAKADVYKVTGPDGKVTYTDSNAEGGANTKVEVVKIDSYTGSAEVSSVEDSPALRKVTIFTTEWCGVCRKAKAYMASHGVAYDELDIEKSRSAKTKFDQLGGRAVPVILVGKEKMIGFSPSKFEAMLGDAGI
ncbi:glutaredoxin domain-containing protein [Methylocaldum sp.]|uniref:glutaredoxin domain-containing protein n=1 Tax=Methylocaldum sp. TaxID=1969727 RepID=UPI002D447F39|nr:glutaredoxin domain-containing protein [Methylocaldum sp.]HYE35101.1 glutaredoxin domain-containing protein [Methylocaldum sp.]